MDVQDAYKDVFVVITVLAVYGVPVPELLSNQPTRYQSGF